MVLLHLQNHKIFDMYKSISFLILAVIFISSNYSCGERTKSPEELKRELKNMELKSPVMYLSIENTTMTPQKKLIREGGLFRSAEYAPDGYIVTGQIKNTATLAKYKDAQIRFSYVSATNTEMASEMATIYEFFEPNSTKSFSVHVYPPAGIKTYNVNVTDAEGIIIE